jgi:hypothetical protein
MFHKKLAATPLHVSTNEKLQSLHHDGFSAFITVDYIF